MLNIQPQELKREPRQIGQYGVFHELQVGAGSQIFKANRDGVFSGATTFSAAPLKWTYAGAFTATNATISGAISAATIDIGGADATSFHVDINGNIWSGHAAFASAPFKVSNAGALTATGATISGAISGSTIDIGGADATSFHVDINGNIWSGAAAYADGPFKVSNAGALTATNATVTGTINATAGSITGDLLVGTTTGSAVTIKGTTGVINLLYDNTLKGTISGYTTAAHSENSYVRLSAESGRTLTLMESMIEIDGNINPAADFGSSLGGSALRWNDVYAKSIIAHGTDAKFSINGTDGQSIQVYVADSAGGAVDRKLTFTKGILTATT